MKSILWILIWGGIPLILSISGGYTVEYQNGSYLNVLASRLNIRSKPSIKGKVIGSVPYGARIKILHKTKWAYQSEGIKGNWVRISTGNKIGYVFDGYLSPLPAPPKDCKSLKHYADSQLIPVGSLQKIDKSVITKNREHMDVVSIQKYKLFEVIHEEHMGYEESWYILKIKDITLEEAFLIGRLCANEHRKNIYRKKPFSLNKKDQFYSNPQATIHVDLTIEKDSEGYIKITSYGGV